MALTTYDDLIEQVAANKCAWFPLWGEAQSTTVILGGNNQAMQAVGNMQLLPSLGSMTDFFPTSLYLVETFGFRQLMLAKVIDLGSLDISGASGTFTDGSAMPSEVELGNSAAPVSGPVWIEVTTALNATPGAFTITYTDQDGNTGQTSVSQNLNVSGTVRSSGWVTLATGDVGVRDITAAARTGGTTPTGVVKFWGILPVCMVRSVAANLPRHKNLLSQSFFIHKMGASDRLKVFAQFTNIGVYGGGIFFVGGE